MRKHFKTFRIFLLSAKSVKGFTLGFILFLSIFLKKKRLIPRSAIRPVEFKRKNLQIIITQKKKLHFRIRCRRKWGFILNTYG